MPSSKHNLELTPQECSIVLKALERYEFYLKNFTAPDQASLDCIGIIANKIDDSGLFVIEMKGPSNA